MTDAARPRIHLTAREGWINDPLGLTWHDGGYHVFFQYVPGRTTWAPDCRWGHAVAPDLVGWRELEPALEPGDGDDGVWSGSLVVDGDGAATILYTSVREEDLDAGRVRLARPDDDSWRTWTKGPIVLEAPVAPRTRIFRDPFVFRDGDRWRMLVGGSTEGPTAVALAYSSDDLETWEADGIAAERASSLEQPVWTGDGWECPQLIEVDGVDVLVLSVWRPDAIHHVAAATGEWHDARFDVSAWQPLTDGPGYYAPSVFRDRDGHPGIVFWIREVGGETAGWSGAMSVPHRMTVVDGVLVLHPHPDVVAASTVLEVGGAAEVATDGPTLVRSIAGIATDLRIAEDGFRTLRVRGAGDDLVLDVGDEPYARFPRSGERLEVLVDGPVVELWHGPTVFAATR